MDEAEVWLQEHDVDYDRASRDWQHVKTGDYVAPRQEVAVGDASIVEWLVSTGEGRWVVPLGERACEACDRFFVPREAKQRFCSETCRGRMEKRRQRARQRP